MKKKDFIDLSHSSLEKEYFIEKMAHIREVLIILLENADLPNGDIEISEVAEIWNFFNELERNEIVDNNEVAEI